MSMVSPEYYIEEITKDDKLISSEESGIDENFSAAFRELR